MANIEIVEVGPRDGLQNEPKVLEVESRIEYINSLIASGMRRIEAVSFVRDDRVPQMARAEEVIKGVDRRPESSLIGLVMNVRGAERALVSNVDELNFVVLASETFSQRNQGMSIDESVRVFSQVRELIGATGIRLTATIGATFGCPFEGDTPISRVRDLTGRLIDAGADELAFADTIGVAVPSEVARVVEAARGVSRLPLRLHLHNTRNTGYANALMGASLGVESLDASSGGIGGCPFAPQATGNIATEDLLYQLRREGHRVEGKFESLLAVTDFICGALGKSHSESMLGAAGWFP